VVGIWVTNDPRHYHRAVELLEEWGCEFTATWYWLKLSLAGMPVCDLASLHRKPYEMLLIGTRGVSPATGNPWHREPILTHRRIFGTVPEAHSRKPAPDALFAELIANNGGHKGFAPCELFARNLQPGWTSCGNQVLLFQEEEHFEPR